MALTKKPAAAPAKPAAAPAKPAPAATKPAPAAPAKPAAAPAPAEETTALAPKSTEALATSHVDLAADAEQYEQQYGRQDLATPFLRILQSNSPEVTPGGEGYIEDAKPGMILNTATKELWEGMNDGVVVIPAYYSRTYIEWVMRENGSGFVADHGLVEGERLLGTCSKDDKGRDVLPNGNQLVSTANHFVVVYGEGEPQPVLLTMTSTQLKKSRQWNTRMASTTVQTPNGMRRRAPQFAMSYRLRTALEKNDKGQWYGWVIESNGKTIETLGERWYLAARDFCNAVRSGNVVVKHEANAPVADAAATEEIPF